MERPAPTAPHRTTPARRFALRGPPGFPLAEDLLDLDLEALDLRREQRVAQPVVLEARAHRLGVRRDPGERDLRALVAVEERQERLTLRGLARARADRPAPALAQRARDAVAMPRVVGVHVRVGLALQRDR